MQRKPTAWLSAGASGIVLAAGVAVVAITYWRLWFGVDLTDESFYVVVPYRFVLGARPFVDETSVTQQTTALLVYPFVRAYSGLVGTTGIVLFVRHLQFLLSLLVGWSVFVSLRGLLDRRAALLLSLTTVAFAPFTIHSLGYNAVGSGLFTAGCLLGTRSLADPDAARSRLLSAVCFGLAAFAYPPLLLPAALCVGVRLALAGRARRREAVAHGLPALGLPVAGMAGLVAAAGLSKVVDDYRRSSRFLGQAGGISKLSTIVHHEWTRMPLWWVLLPTLAGLLLLWRLHRGLALPALVALPFLVLPPRPLAFEASLEYVAHFSWLGLPLFLLVRRRPGATPLFLTVWIPGLVAGLTTAYSSANGGVNFGVGAFPAAIATAAFLVLAVADAVRVRSDLLALAPALAVLTLLVAMDTLPVYRDGSLSTLTARVASGPYAGLATSSWKRRWLARLEADLAPVGQGCTIVFFDDFPAGYLLTKARPDTNGAWIASVDTKLEAPYQHPLIGYYREHGYPDVAVVVRRIPYTHHTGRTLLYPTREPLLATVHSRSYRLERWRRPYAVYLNTHSTCGSRPAGRTTRALPVHA